MTPDQAIQFIIKSLQDHATVIYEGLKANLDSDLVRFKATIESTVLRHVAEGTAFDVEELGHSINEGLARTLEKGAKDLRKQ